MLMFYTKSNGGYAPFEGKIILEDISSFLNHAHPSFVLYFWIPAIAFWIPYKWSKSKLKQRY